MPTPSRFLPGALGPTSRVWRAVLALVVALVFAGHFRGWFQQRKEETRPKIALHTKAVERWRPDLETVNLVTFEPPPKEVARLEREYGVGLTRPGNDGAQIRNDRKILGEFKIDPLPYGGRALVTSLPGDPVEMRVVANPRKWAELVNRYGWTAGVGLSNEGTVLLGRAWWKAARTGKLTWGGEVGGLATPLGTKVYGVVTISME